MRKLIRFIATVGVFACILAAMPNQSVYADSSDNVYYLGEGAAQKTNGEYAKGKEITKGDMHYGWNLGKFEISGFTRRIDSDGNDIYLKSVGDEISLSFLLEQDIEQLNGKDSLYISEDKKAQDAEFDVTENKEFGIGTLLIKKTDYQNNVTYSYYTDYLKGVESGANTEIKLLEEGDYEIALDYRVSQNHLTVAKLNTLPTSNNYKIKISFSIRNGNCMVYPFDTVTKTELVNTSFTSNGFYLYLAMSRYLNLDVKKSKYVESEGVLIEDTRFNSAISDGTEFTDEGIYTITVSNIYTGNKTEKKIYVGSNPLLQAYVTTGKDIEYIKELVSQGATINDDGTITLPNNEVVAIEQEDVSVEDITAGSTENVESNSEELKDSTDVTVLVICIIAVLIAIVAVLVWNRYKKSNF
jgi:hypothetical protein